MRKVKVAIPIVDNEEVDAVTKVLFSGNYTSGLRVEEFEKRFAEYIGVNYAIAVNSGTAALHLSLACTGIMPGDEVIVPAMTFFATASAVVHQGAIPIFCDVDNNYCMDPEDLKKRITPKTKAIIPVHFYGYAANMTELLKISKEHNLKLIEDCAQGIGTELNNKRVGQFGDAGAFSFFATKNMTTIEGGMITTNSKLVAEKAKSLRSHGLVNRNDHEYIGYNYRMSEVNAAVGLVQLAKLDRLNEIRYHNSKYLLNKLKEVSWLIIAEEPANVKHSYFWCPIRIDEGKLGMSTLELRNLLFEKGIETRHRYVEPLYKQKALQKATCSALQPGKVRAAYHQTFLKNAEAFSGKVIGLPNHPNLTQEELDYIVQVIKEVKR